VAAVLSILALLFMVRQMDNPVGENMRSGLRYVLTTDWDVRPAMEKAVKFGLQMAGVDSNLDSGMPQDGTMKAMSPKGEVGPLAIPVSGRVVREYGWNKDSLDDMERFHPGIDIAAKAGAPVKAALAGKVKKVGADKQLGSYVVLDHGEGVYTLYAGIENIKVAEGQEVQAGQTIADVAKAGDVSGGGLHFELREGGVLTNPLDKIDFPPVK
jgi:murein DD-endopeptidase MepM/ murein hydrolase activator NlpD